MKNAHRDSSLVKEVNARQEHVQMVSQQEFAEGALFLCTRKMDKQIMKKVNTSDLWGPFVCLTHPHVCAWNLRRDAALGNLTDGWIKTVFALMLVAVEQLVEKIGRTIMIAKRMPFKNVRACNKIYWHIFYTGEMSSALSSRQKKRRKKHDTSFGCVGRQVCAITTTRHTAA